MNYGMIVATLFLLVMLVVAFFFGPSKGHDALRQAEQLGDPSHVSKFGERAPASISR